MNIRKIIREELGMLDFFNIYNKSKNVANYFDFKIFNKTDVINILTKYPELYNKFDFKKLGFDDEDFSIITDKHPDLKSKFKNYTSNNSGGNNDRESNMNNPSVIEQITKDAKSYSVETFPKSYIKFFNSKNITDVLIRNKNLFPLFKSNDLDKLIITHIAVIVIKQPDLADEFNMDMFNSNIVPEIIIRNPVLIKKFSREKLNTLNSSDVSKIIQKYPNLKTYF